MLPNLFYRYVCFVTGTFLKDLCSIILVVKEILLLEIKVFTEEDRRFFVQVFIGD